MKKMIFSFIAAMMLLGSVNSNAQNNVRNDEAAAKLPLKRGQTCIYWGVWELRNRPYQN